MIFSAFNKKTTGLILAIIVSNMPFHDALAKSKDVCVPGSCPFITNGLANCNNPAFECPIVCAAQTPALAWNKNWACYSEKNKLKCEYNELETFCGCDCEET